MRDTAVSPPTSSSIPLHQQEVLNFCTSAQPDYNQLMSTIAEQLNEKKVLVTGATGFIGGSLAQRLALEEKATVTGTGRTLDKVPFLKEVGVTLQQADLLDETAMRAVLANQEIVFHVAAWMGGGRVAEAEAEAYALNVTATEQLLRWAKEANVARVVLVSSVATYGVPTKALLDENTPLDSTQTDIYGRTKALGDLNAQKLAQELNLDLSIVRPAIVYGPRSWGWTLHMFRLVQKGTPVIFGDGSGYMSPLFIDNLIDGMLLTAVSPQAIGEAFNFSDPPITWKQFFTYYGDMCAKKPRQMPLFAAHILAFANKLFKLGLPLNKARLKFLTQQATYPITKAETRLGYTPRISIDEGMALAEAWLREEGYLENVTAK